MEMTCRIQFSKHQPPSFAWIMYITWSMVLFATSTWSFCNSQRCCLTPAFKPVRYTSMSPSSLKIVPDDEDIEQIPMDFFLEDDSMLDRERLEMMTVSQLRQQLRLRNLKVSGKKDELLDRLVQATKDDSNVMSSNTNENSYDEKNHVQGSDTKQTKSSGTNSSKSKARAFAESKGKQLVDISEYLDDADKGKDTKTSQTTGKEDYEGDDEPTEGSNPKSSSSPETWGDEAKIIEDYEGRSVVIDGLSRTVIQFKGSQKRPVQAYVVASRDALKAFLKGGNGVDNSTVAITTNISQELEEATLNIQKSREKASKTPLKLEDIQGEDVDDEEGLYTNILDRDYGDWGKYSLTGVQLSAQETKGVLLLPDVHGPFSDDIQALADKIAFECQPIVVFCPDLFNGNPWKATEHGSSEKVNHDGQSFEEWRASLNDVEISVNIRAAAACMRQTYGVASLSVFGLCYGGGRALEVTARVYPNDSMNDVNDEPGPPHVDPSTCVAWYPTRYDAKSLFGKKKKSLLGNIDGSTPANSNSSSSPNTAVMAIFAAKDTIPGATVKDAEILKQCLDEDDTIKDSMVKVFNDQDHGFAHIGISKSLLREDNNDSDDFLREEFGGMPSRNIDDGDAEVASLLSTAWMETYSRSFLPTVGEAVKDDGEWSSLNMPDLSMSKTRDIRKEIEQAMENQPEVELDLKRMHPDDFKTPIDDLEDMDQDFYRALQTQPYGVSLEDLQDPDLFLDKLEAALDRDDLEFLPGFGNIPLDDSVDGPAYW